VKTKTRIARSHPRTKTFFKILARVKFRESDFSPLLYKFIIAKVISANVNANGNPSGDDPNVHCATSPTTRADAKLSKILEILLTARHIFQNGKPLLINTSQ
jgi:hypothetical protein